MLENGHVSVTTAETGGISVCRMSHTEIDGRMSRLHFEYLIGRPAGIERATEVHDLGLFTPEEMHECFRQAELQVTFEPVGLSGRGLYVARAA